MAAWGAGLLLLCCFTVCAQAEQAEIQEREDNSDIPAKDTKLKLRADGPIASIDQMQRDETLSNREIWPSNSGKEGKRLQPRKQKFDESSISDFERTGDTENANHIYKVAEVIDNRDSDRTLDFSQAELMGNRDSDRILNTAYIETPNDNDQLLTDVGIHDDVTESGGSFLRHDDASHEKNKQILDHDNAMSPQPDSQYLSHVTNKRAFDSIGLHSGFRKFGKHQSNARKYHVSQGEQQMGENKRQTIALHDKRHFDSIASSSGFGKFGKRLDLSMSETGTDKHDVNEGKLEESLETSRDFLSKFRNNENKESEATDGEMFLNSRKEHIYKSADYSRPPEVSKIPQKSTSTSKLSLKKITPSGSVPEMEVINEVNSGVPRNGNAEKRRFDSIGKSSVFGKFGKRENIDFYWPKSDTFSEERRQLITTPTSAQASEQDNLNGGSRRQFDRTDSRLSSSGGTTDGGRETIKTLAKLQETDFLKSDKGDHSLSLSGRQIDNIVGLSSFGKVFFHNAAIPSKLQYITENSFETKENNDNHSNLQSFKSVFSEGKEPLASLERKEVYDDVDSETSKSKCHKCIKAESTSHNFNEQDLFNSIPKLRSKRQLDFDSQVSDLDDFQKRRFDSIGSTSKFGGFGKRRFDSIASSSKFGGFGKRRFDSIASSSKFGGFGKRRFDSIASSSKFGGFGKRRFDSIASSSKFGGFGKRRFDSIASSSKFGGFGKRRFDSIASSSKFGGFGKRRLDSIASSSRFGGFGKRRFDSIASSSKFGGFGKRNTIDAVDDRIQEVSPVSDNTGQAEVSGDYDVIGMYDVARRVSRSVPVAINDGDYLVRVASPSSILTPGQITKDTSRYLPRLDSFGRVFNYDLLNAESGIESLARYFRKLEKRDDKHSAESDVDDSFQARLSNYIVEFCMPFILGQIGNPFQLAPVNEDPESLAVDRDFDKIAALGFSGFGKRVWHGLGTEPVEKLTIIKQENIGERNYLPFCRLALEVKDSLDNGGQQSGNSDGSISHSSNNKRQFDRIAYGQFAKWGRK